MMEHGDHRDEHEGCKVIELRRRPMEIKAKVYLIGLSGLVVNTLSECDHI